MAKLSALVLVATAALAMVWLAPHPDFVVAPARPRAAQAAAQRASTAPEAPRQAPAAQTAAAAVLVGLLVGLAASPLAASAGVARSLPDFSLSRPEYMQGVDASNAAKRPGEVDYVTRSQIQWMQLDKAREEATLHNSLVKDSHLGKAQRVERAKLEVLRQLGLDANIPA